MVIGSRRRNHQETRQCRSHGQRNPGLPFARRDALTSGQTQVNIGLHFGGKAVPRWFRHGRGPVHRLPELPQLRDLFAAGGALCNVPREAPSGPAVQVMAGIQFQIGRKRVRH
jgi:hypothetical protein